MGVMSMSATTSQPAVLAGRGVHGSLKMLLNGVKKDRLSMLDEECVSWRGCTGPYEQPRAMDLNNPDTVYPDLGQGSRFTVTLTHMLCSFATRHNSSLIFNCVQTASTTSLRHGTHPPRLRMSAPCILTDVCHSHMRNPR